MKRILLFIAPAFFTLSACSALTDVENPNVTDAAFLRSPGATSAWLRGCERQWAQTLDLVLIGAEIASDNYFNNRTLYNRKFDIPSLESSDADIAAIAQAIGRLRSMAEYGLQTVAAADGSTTAAQRAELYFFKGVAHLYCGDYFTALPAEALGAPVSAQEQYALAAAALEQALALGGADAATQAGYWTALARAHYYAGNKAKAVEAAQKALAVKAAFARFAQFDPVSAPSAIQVALYTGQDEFEPLPRLDFLDPKYYKRSASQESPVCGFKAEEALLILAEARVAENNLAEARSTLQTLLSLVAERAVETVDERAEQRGRRGTLIYPNSDTLLVAASPQDVFRAGLTRARGSAAAFVKVPVVSGSSVAAAMLDEASASAEKFLELIYLMRQEIFLAEGRRMPDLGIKFPLPDLETQNNPQAAAELAANPAWKQGQIPPFIPLASGMNAFDYDAPRGRVVIRYNMNRVIVEQRATGFVAPFH